MLRHCSASTLSYVEGSTLLRAVSPSTSLRTVSLSNGLSNGPSALLRAMSLSNGRWAFSDSLIRDLGRRSEGSEINLQGKTEATPGGKKV
jgi:hypothetical protein